jgi:hypothetical protein
MHPTIRGFAHCGSELLKNVGRMRGKACNTLNARQELGIRLRRVEASSESEHAALERNVPPVNAPDRSEIPINSD